MKNRSVECECCANPGHELCRGFGSQQFAGIVLPADGQTISPANQRMPQPFGGVR